MNAVTQAVMERQHDASPLGEISAAWQITPEAVLVVGWQQEKPAVDGTVSYQRLGAPKGRFRSLAWPFTKAGANAYHFISALQLPAGAVGRAGDTLLLTGKGEPTGVLARLPPRFLEGEDFGLELARIAAGSALPLARFLTDTLSAGATQVNADIRGFLHAFLERASAVDGCIEIAGAVDEQCVILQGWGGAPGPACEMIVVGESIERVTPHLAVFSRPDMRGTACGQLVVLPGTLARGLPQIKALVILDRRGLRWRPLLPERQLLSSQETVGHLQGALPGLQCDPATRTWLQDSMRPRFDGRFTLYDGGHPIRLAIDLAASGAMGSYLTGWLYDPANVVTDIHLCSTGGATARLNGRWTRIVRADVTDAFRNETELPKSGGQHRHGFAVFADTVASAEGEAVFLDVSFRDGRCGFVPLDVDPADSPAMQARLLAGVDLHKPSGLPIVEQQLGPFFACLNTLVTPTEPDVLTPIPAAWATALVVPLADAIPPRALLSQFLRDQLAIDEGVVFVLGENWTEAAIDTLRDLSQFYGVSAAIVRIRSHVNATVALVTIAGVAQTKRLLLLAPGTVGRTPGWRSALHTALDQAGGNVCVSPTVVYEDESIRFAGTDAIDALDSAPYVRIQRRLAGMPVCIIDRSDAERTATPSPACCLMPVEAVKRASTPVYLAKALSMQETGLALLFKANGTKLVWTASAQVYAADAPGHETSETAARVERLVDGWCLRSRLTDGNK